MSNKRLAPGATGRVAAPSPTPLSPPSRAPLNNNFNHLQHEPLYHQQQAQPHWVHRHVDSNDVCHTPSSAPPPDSSTPASRKGWNLQKRLADWERFLDPARSPSTTGEASLTSGATPLSQTPGTTLNSGKGSVNSHHPQQQGGRRGRSEQAAPGGKLSAEPSGGGPVRGGGRSSASAAETSSAAAAGPTPYASATPSYTAGTTTQASRELPGSIPPSSQQQQQKPQHARLRMLPSSLPFPLPRVSPPSSRPATASTAPSLSPSSSYPPSPQGHRSDRSQYYESDMGGSEDGDVDMGALWREVYNVEWKPREAFLKFRQRILNVRLGANVELRRPDPLLSHGGLPGGYYPPHHDATGEDPADPSHHSNNRLALVTVPHAPPPVSLWGFQPSAANLKFVLKPARADGFWKLMFEPQRGDVRFLTRKIRVLGLVNVQLGVGHDFKRGTTGWKWKVTPAWVSVPSSSGSPHISHKHSLPVWPGFDARIGWNIEYVLPDIHGALGTGEPSLGLNVGRLYASLERVEAIFTLLD